MKGSTKRDSVSELAFRVRYLRRSRELYRRYLESKPWLRELYSRFFDIKPGQRLVDVGCGTGDFTRYLARISGGKSKILGIDSNEKSLKAAIADTTKAGLSRTISYRMGDVNKIPLKDGYANITCCRTLLMHLPDPLAAVKEMARITTMGGSVIAVEGGKMASFYDPDDEEYSRLAERAYSAWVDGVKKLEGKEFKIGEKLPGIFRKAGLSSIKSKIQADAWLFSDPRRKLSDIRADLRFEYAIFKERRRKDRKYLLAGGVSNSWITSYFNRLAERTRRSLRSKDTELRNNASLYGATLFLVSGVRKG
ncbi:MAG TPA: methyltransferase domain-containing protein [Candidatus Bathyarchaeia archaeon]|nr:methyltransferase domain-containing protein [Candidatus Bathyarchaeia archaeon]